MRFGTKMLKGYIAITISILAVIVYIMLSGLGTRVNMEYIILSVLLILLIGASLLNTIVNIHVYEELDEMNERKS